MKQYKISYGKLGSEPICQMQDSLENLFLDKSKGTLPLVLQHYYEYLKTKDVSDIIILLEGAYRSFKVRLFSGSTITKEQVLHFFEHWYGFIELQRSYYKTSIFVEIEGNDFVLEVYKEYKDAQEEKLKLQEIDMDDQIIQDTQPTIQKWAIGTGAVLGVVGFAVGGSLAACASTVVGCLFGGVLGISQAFKLEPSSASKEKLNKYFSSKEILEYDLKVIPLREKESQAVCKKEEKGYVPQIKSSDNMSPRKLKLK